MMLNYANSNDSTVINTVLSWLEDNPKLNITLVTLTHVSGSGPRKEGAMLAIAENDSRTSLVGSVSGGCIEEDLLARYSKKAAHKPIKHVYGINQEEAAKFQLPCGASVEVIAEPFHDLSHIRQIQENLVKHQRFYRILDKQTGDINLIDYDDFHHNHRHLDIQDYFSQAQQKNHALYNDNDTLVRVFGPSWRAFIVGANDIAAHLVPILQSIDFDIILCEPRKAYRDSWQDFNQHNHTLQSQQIVFMEPDEWLLNNTLTARDVALFISHDAKIEDLAILSALQSDAFYVGALGSRKTTGKRYQRLVEHFDADPLLLEQLDAPIGFDLRSKTTPEIAVAIAAKLIAVKNGMSKPDIMTDAKAGLQASLHSSSVKALTLK